MQRLDQFTGAEYEIRFMQSMIRHHWAAVREAETCLARAEHQDPDADGTTTVDEVPAGRCEAHDDLAAVGRRHPLDQAALLRAIDVSASEVRTPLMFEHQLMERARKDRKHIVLPEAGDDRILTAADILLRRGVADLTLRLTCAGYGAGPARARTDIPPQFPLRFSPGRGR